MGEVFCGWPGGDTQGDHCTIHSLEGTRESQQPSGSTHIGDLGWHWIKVKKSQGQGLTSITYGPKNVYTKQGHKKAVVIKMWDWQDLNFEIYVSQMERSRNILKTIESPIHILVWESRGPFRLKVFKHSEFPLSDARHLKILLIIHLKKKHVPLSIRLITKPKMYLCTCLQSVSG